MNETTITMKMACIPGIPNVNNVVYSKECFQKAFQNYMENKDSIPVTINPDYSTLTKIQSVDVSKVIGEIRSLDDFSNDFEFVNFHKNPYNKITEDIVKILHSIDYELGLRYMAKPRASILGHTDVTDMKIIAFDILPRKNYEDEK